MTPDNGIDTFVAAADGARMRGDDQTISDNELAQVITAAVKLYAARTERLGKFPAPLVTSEVSATEALTAICEMIRAVDVNMFEVSMWHGRASVRAQE